MGNVRIIGGQWRGRKIEFPDHAGLRPTPDRLRETLFNWLMPTIGQAVCLDLFAGSGALGFEALSRGAKKVYFVEKETPIVAALKKNAEKFNAENSEIFQVDFEKNPPRFPPHTFDIVFLDPPYNSQLIQSALHWLQEKTLLKPDALIYGETKKGSLSAMMPEGFKIFKESSTTTIHYFLMSLDRS